MLGNAVTKRDLRNEWKFPDLSVLTELERAPRRCDLSRPSYPLIINNTIKHTGHVAGILVRVYMHAPQLGAARDLAHLPKINEGHGFYSNQIRKFMRHGKKTVSNHRAIHWRLIYVWLRNSLQETIRSFLLGQRSLARPLHLLLSGVSINSVASSL